MQKILLSICFMLVVGLVSAQVDWSDDFESYNDGDLIGATSPDWTTWSGSPGGADDAAISGEEANSGNLSLKLTSFQSGGGPTDIVLPFQQKFTSGGFTFEMMMYVAGGTGAYFNFQAEETVGVNWAQETVFNSDGSLVVRSNNQTPISGTYEHDKWFKVTWLLDLDNNRWELIVDGQCLGFFTNNWNAVASLNLYPVSDNNTSVYYVDDVSFSHDPNGLPPINVDGGLGNLSLKPRTLAGTELPVSGQIQNSGSEDITSFKVELTTGGNSQELTFDNLLVSPGGTYDFDSGETITVGEGATSVEMTLLEVNGQKDERECNDYKSASVTGVVPAENKRVLVEEATGTWCTWCPRGDVFVRWMVRDYPDYFIPIAVHGPTLQSDPMTDQPHIDYVRTIPGFNGYPYMLIERKEWFGFGVIEDVENRFFNEIIVPVDAVLEIGAQFDAGSRQLDVSTGVDFTGGNGGDYSIDVIVIENNINEDDPAYNQINAYAGGARGPMGGYENLPNPVPAKDMFYQHVSRGSMTTFEGVELSGFNAGDRPVANFSATLADNIDESEVYLVAVFSNADGSVNNTFEVSLQEAIDNGFEDATVSTKDRVALEGSSMFPNPAQNRTFVKLDLEESSSVEITVVNLMGQTVAHRDYGQVQGSQAFPVDLRNMPNGMYEIRIQVGQEMLTKKLQVIQ